MFSPFSRVELGLLKKYDQHGPRYTSYPPAPVFTADFTAEHFKDEILATNGPESRSDISLYFHFPFCDTLCYFCGCTMLVTRDRKRMNEYNHYLKKEIALVAPMIAQDRKVTQLHWGGGTPTHLFPEEILDMAEYVKGSFRIDPEVEMSVEIDPRELTQRHLSTLKHVGFNRLSMGVQDFNPNVQKAVNRIQPEEMTVQVFEWASSLDFESINIDLIYGLPFQTVESFEETLQRVLQFRPDRIAVFNYAHVPWLKPHQKLIHPEDLPSSEEKIEILKMTIELLTSRGYLYIGMDHFAKLDDELAKAQKEKTLCRNFQGYSTKAGADLYGFGMSSISHFQNSYAQNYKALPDYYEALNAGLLATHVGYRMTEDDHIRKHVIMRLMCNLEVDKKAIEEQFDIDFDEHFDSSLRALEQFVDDGLVHLALGKIAIIGAGRLLLRNIAMCFDAHLDTMRATKPIFSRTL
ncbi:MAG: oxygen-independent coproporphyrinogen III oxidase [Ignavibacteria bacterium]|nr:oxygen-independent coproporphyrinogen III oxidase [Ignavibacteria bacterium]